MGGKAAADAQRIVDMVFGFHPDFTLSAEPDRPRAPSLQTNQFSNPFPFLEQNCVRM